MFLLFIGRGAHNVATAARSTYKEAFPPEQETQLDPAGEALITCLFAIFLPVRLTPHTR